jgi:hypothetical protein
MGASGAQQLDINFLSGQARGVAMDVAAENQLDLTAEALPAVDKMVEEREEQIKRTWKDLDTWKGHVRHISVSIAEIYKSRGAKRISDPDELIKTSRPIYNVYPYG